MIHNVHELQENCRILSANYDWDVNVWMKKQRLLFWAITSKQLIGLEACILRTNLWTHNAPKMDAPSQLHASSQHCNYPAWIYPVNVGYFDKIN